MGNNETVDRIKAEGGQAVGFKVNITDKEQIMTMHAAVRDQMGPVDILVNNAAVVETTLFANPEADDTISEIVNTNLLGQIWVSNLYGFTIIILLGFTDTSTQHEGLCALV